MNKDGFVYTVIFTFVGAFAFVFLLSLANSSTIEIVEANRKIEFYGAILRAAGLETEGKDIQKQFQQTFPGMTEEEVASTDLFQTDVNGRTVLIRRFSGPGLWGTVSGVLAVDEPVDQIVGIEITSHNETPGLGGRIEEDWFKDQFRNEAIPNGEITVRKGTGNVDTDSSNATVDGITGASLTSKSIEVIVNNTLEKIESEKGGM